MSNAVAIESKESLADAEFENYDFGDGVRVSESDNWNSDDEEDFTKMVYITCDGDDPEADSERVSFHVRFWRDGSVSEAYGLLMKSGNYIGFRPAGRADKDAMSETWSAGA